MIPVTDDIPRDRLPVVTFALLAAIAVVFPVAGLEGGVVAVLADLLFLWLLGPTVEDALGRPRFAAFLAAGGGLAALVQLGLGGDGHAAIAGATGAVAAVLGAYVRLYPWGRVLAVVLAVLFSTIVAVPLAAVLGAWAALQVALAALGGPAALLAAQAVAFALGAAAARPLAVQVKTPEVLVARGRAALS